VRAEISVPMASPRQAGMALKAVGGDGFETSRASLSLSVSASTLNAVVSAKDFAALRARTTSLFRDLKVFLDSARASGK